MAMDFQLLTALAEKMKWHQARAKLLAENVANAETPGYRGRDLTPFGFDDYLKAGGQWAAGPEEAARLAGPTTAAIQTAATQPGHITVFGTGADGFGPRTEAGFEVTPEGNSVTLEDEMMKVSSNAMDYQTITSLYSRTLQLFRTALGKDV